MQPQFKLKVIKPGEAIPSCCPTPQPKTYAHTEVGTGKSISTPAGDVPVVPTLLSASDKLGTVKARVGVGRMQYTIAPGLYAVGNPTDGSEVLISANYKLSFDALRRELGGLDLWILVLDTRGINVWCAAGKGTFGTDELLARIKACGLEKVVAHRRLIAPQLGAPGISAHAVRKSSGFKIKYGPVRAADIREFLDSDMKATPLMRRVDFTFSDRLVLVPIEIVMGLKIASLLALAIAVVGFLTYGGFDINAIIQGGVYSWLIFMSAFVLSGLLAPVLLPWLPGRAFSLKGIALGGLISAGLLGFVSHLPVLTLAGWALIITALASFVTMNFTGASTYTSLSGVMKEMKFYVPVQITMAVIGIGLFTGGNL